LLLLFIFAYYDSLLITIHSLLFSIVYDCLLLFIITQYCLH